MAAKMSILEQVALMLKKAETTTPEEAEMITRRAEKLMLKHGLDEAMIAAAGAKAQREAIVEERITFTSGSYSDAHLSIGYSVVRGFGTLRALQSTYGKTRTLYVIGFESDVRSAVMLINSLKEQSEQAMTAWWIKAGRDETAYLGRQGQWKARREFFYAFGTAVFKRLRETTQEVLDEAGGKGTDLVLVSRGEAVQEHINSTYNVGKARGGNRDYSSHGRSAGYEAGTKAHFGKSIGS